MPWRSIAERKNSREPDGTHRGGIAVTCVWVLKAEETKNKKGANEKMAARIIQRKNPDFCNNILLIRWPPAIGDLPFAHM
jgi:hypothetical protein